MTENNASNTAPSQVPAWFERKFEFTFPVELYLNLCVRVRDTPARVDEISAVYRVRS